ncbi:MAG TPA: glycerophosphodiester phosphodiesterase [Burkholderiales bacterium]|nr:glycerophosphodiester phosphodiesterase [Burkholderiales bacterium]
MLVLAHRGFHRHVPENTMAAFAAAVELMVDGIETDIRFSRDGVALLFHDALARNGEAVADLTHRQLEHISGFAVPTIAHALARWPALFWDLEIKAPAAPERIAEVLKPYQDSHRLLLTSFDHKLILSLARLLESDCGLLFDERVPDLKSYLSRHATPPRVGTIVVDYKILSEALVDDAEALGFRTFVYGAVSRQDHARCLALDLAAVITDYPDRIPNRQSNP